MDKEDKFPGFHAGLPPRVRYDKGLRPMAKILYAEISAMSNVTGFCWASNRYLAALYDLNRNTVTALLGQLEEAGFIRIEVIRDEKNAVTERRLYITAEGMAPMDPPRKNEDTPPHKNADRGIHENADTPPHKNAEENITSKELIPPYSPPRGGRARAQHKNAPDWKPEMFVRLWEWYPTGDKAMHSKRGNKQKAIRAWDKLHPDDGLVDVMSAALARQARSSEWQEGVAIPHLSTWLNNAGWEGWEADEV